MSKEKIIVAIILLVVIGLALKNFPFNQSNLDKNMPPIITSFDLFAGTSYAKYIYDTEDAIHDPPYRVFGLKTITVQPIFYFLHIAAFTKLTNISVYQTTVFITQFLGILTVLIFFLIIRKFFNSKLALLCSALAFIPEYQWFFQMYIGFQYDLYSYLFIPAFLFFVLYFLNNNYKRKEMFLFAILAGFFSVSQWLAHFVELIVFAPFLAGVVLWQKYKNKIEFPIMKFLTIFLIVSAPLFLYSYPVFNEGHLSKGFSETLQKHFQPGVYREPPNYWPPIRFNTTLNIFSIIGAIFIFINWKSNKLTQNQKILIAFLIYTILVGFSNYVGFEPNRFSRQLYSSMPLLVLLPAFGVYSLINLISSAVKTDKLKFPLIVAVILIVVIFQFPKTYSALSQIDAGSFVDDEKWESLMWIKDNLPNQSKVFYLNGFVHEFEMFAEKPYMEGTSIPFPDGIQRNFETICSGKYPEVLGGQWGNGQFAGRGRYLKERTGLSSWNYIAPLNTSKEREMYVYNQSQAFVPMKFFDYIVAQYNDAYIGNTKVDSCIQNFVQESLKRGNSLLWKNNKMAVLKVNKT